MCNTRASPGARHKPAVHGRPSPKENLRLSSGGLRPGTGASGRPPRLARAVAVWGRGEPSRPWESAPSCGTVGDIEQEEPIPARTGPRKGPQCRGQGRGLRRAAGTTVTGLRGPVLPGAQLRLPFARGPPSLLGVWERACLLCASVTWWTAPCGPRGAARVPAFTVFSLFFSSPAAFSCPLFPSLLVSALPGGGAGPAEVAGGKAVPALPESGQSGPEPTEAEGGAEAAGNELLGAGAGLRAAAPGLWGSGSRPLPAATGHLPPHCVLPPPPWDWTSGTGLVQLVLHRVGSAHSLAPRAPRPWPDTLSHTAVSLWKEARVASQAPWCLPSSPSPTP